MNATVNDQFIAVFLSALLGAIVIAGVIVIVTSYRLQTKWNTIFDMFKSHPEGKSEMKHTHHERFH